ncbi:MAG: cytochrome c [Acidiferrobacterales bacterium]|nr:cytochrome c [Acidiferrobacterales bacterium]
MSPSAIWISTGLILAVGLASSAVVLFPEDRVQIGIAVHEPIDYQLVPKNASLAELERGRSYYIQLCALCHGSNGTGSGEYSYRMVPKPSNLVVDILESRTDVQIDEAIRDGVRGSAMQGWGERLSPVQRRQIIKYIKYLAIKYKHH